jgi:hypothetical protein
MPAVNIFGFATRSRLRIAEDGRRFALHVHALPGKLLTPLPCSMLRIPITASSSRLGSLL